MEEKIFVHETEDCLKKENINHRDDLGRTPIFDVIRRDGDVSLLIEMGADIEVVSDMGEMPIHAAAGRGRKKALRTLLKAGADVNARTKDFGGYGHFTPLEIILFESDIQCGKKYELSTFLIKNGATKTERCQQFVSALSEEVHRHLSGKKITKFLQNQLAALTKLCELFDVEELPARSFHDGVSPIILTVVGGFKDNYKELWDFLVPPRGQAQTAQGEIIRIAGKIEHELLDNGGMNWDEDYQKMLCAFRDYLHIGVPVLSDDAIDEVITALYDGDVNDRMIYRLRIYAKYWVCANPEVIPLLDTDYQR